MQFKLNISTTLKQLLEQEDTDGDKRITIEDNGPKTFVLKDLNGSNTVAIKGTYYLSNLLQELVLAKEDNHNRIDTEKNIRNSYVSIKEDD